MKTNKKIKNIDDKLKSTKVEYLNSPFVQDGTIDEEINDNKNAKKVDIAVVNGNKKISFKYVWASIFFIATIISCFIKNIPLDIPIILSSTGLILCGFKTYQKVKG